MNNRIELKIELNQLTFKSKDEVAEWLRRWTANPLGFAREGSNPFFVVFFLSLFIIICLIRIFFIFKL